MSGQHKIYLYNQINFDKLYLTLHKYMAITEENISAREYVMNMLNDSRSRAEIEATLLQKGHDEKFVKELIAETVKLRDAKRRSQGLVLILTGAVICFSSFLLTITSSFTHTSFPMVLYGLTSLGILVAFTGLIKVF